MPAWPSDTRADNSWVYLLDWLGMREVAPLEPSRGLREQSYLAELLTRVSAENENDFLSPRMRTTRLQMDVEHANIPVGPCRSLWAHLDRLLDGALRRHGSTLLPRSLNRPSIHYSRGNVMATSNCLFFLRHSCGTTRWLTHVPLDVSLKWESSFSILRSLKLRSLAHPCGCRRAWHWRHHRPITAGQRH